MHLLAVLLTFQSAGQIERAPVLAFPEPGLDDPAAYEGYATRFFRDGGENVVQIYVDRRSGRVVHVWADASNASAALSVRDPSGRGVPVSWGEANATVWSERGRRMLQHRLAANTPVLEIGWFLLGTMRQERDFQYLEWHRRPWSDSAFVLPELTGLIASLDRLPDSERARHLALLNAADGVELRGRLIPRVQLARRGAEWVVHVEHTSFDGRNRMTLELRGDTTASSATVSGGVATVRARSGGGVALGVTVSTDAASLTPLGRDRIFNDAFDAFYSRHRRTADSLRQVLSPDRAAGDRRIAAFRRLDREVRGLELLSSEEKLMAALPNYATYFGRDMMMATLMLEPITSVDLQERVIANVLRKLAPTGDVSHEEALGGQAIREHAAEYGEAIRAWNAVRERDPGAAAEHLARAREILGNLQRVRENYRMIDDDFQFPVLVGRYLAREDASAERKRRFLSEMDANGERRLDALMRNLALVARLSRPYVEHPVATNLVGFGYRDADGFLPGSWRDSRVGYGNGRFAMDVNVVWVPHALAALDGIISALEALNLPVDEAVSRAPGDVGTLRTYLDRPAARRTAVAVWRGARSHFATTLEPEAMRQRVDAKLASLPAAERRYWRSRVDVERATARPMTFLALSLDSVGRPITAPSTDPATELFLEDYTEDILRGDLDPAAVTAMLDAFLRPYPAGLLVEGLGPVVVNDAYASRRVQDRFSGDLYHSPRVVWGREVNLLVLGLSRQIDAAYDASGRLRAEGASFRSYVDALRRTLDAIRTAVDASGLLYNELWSYRIEDDALRPVRYGTSSDIQLWNLTDLAVRFHMDRLPPR